MHIHRDLDLLPLQGFQQGVDLDHKADGGSVLAEMGKKETIKCLNNVLLEASKQMKNNYNRADN